MLPLIMLGLTAAKMASDKNKEDRDRWLAAQTQRLSPWTHLQADPVAEANPIGTAAGAFSQNEVSNQNDANLAAQSKLVDAQTNYYNKMGGMGAGAQTSFSPSIGMSDAAQQAGAPAEDNYNPYGGTARPMPGMKNLRY